MSWIFSFASIMFLLLTKATGKISVAHGVLFLGLALQTFIAAASQLTELAFVGRAMLVLSLGIGLIPSLLNDSLKNIFREKKLGIKFALLFLSLAFTFVRQKSLLWGEAFLFSSQALLFLVFYSRLDLWKRFLHTALLFSMGFSYFLFAGKIFPASKFMLPTLWMVCFSLGLLFLNSGLKKEKQTFVKG